MRFALLAKPSPRGPLSCKAERIDKLIHDARLNGTLRSLRLESARRKAARATSLRSDLKRTQRCRKVFKDVPRRIRHKFERSGEQIEQI